MSVWLPKLNMNSVAGAATSVVTIAIPFANSKSKPRPTYVTAPPSCLLKEQLNRSNHEETSADV